jgi:transposase-like protein
MAQREIKRYSLTFKKQVVREYEAGASVPSLMRKYGITGNQTIRNWIRLHSEKGSRTAMKEITDPQTQAELEALKEKVEALEQLVSQLSLDKFMLESCLKVAERELGYEVKKSDVTKRWSKRSLTGRRER